MNPIVINIDVTSSSLSSQLGPKIVAATQASIETSLAVIRDKWMREAQSKLNSTRPLYLMGLDFNSVIFPYGGNAMAGAVQLQGKFPNMLEQGFPAFDQKVGFSKSDRKIQKKDGGWYLTIPIRHSTPNHFMYGREMPKDIYGVAKKLAPYQPGGGGGKLSQSGQGDVSWNGYQRKHKTYDGLVRIVKSYNKATQSQYMTFRRVSDKSDPRSWWHPGFVGVKIAESLEPFAKDTFTKTLTHNLNSIL